MRLIFKFLALIMIALSSLQGHSQDCVSKRHQTYRADGNFSVIYYAKSTEKILKSFGFSLVKTISKNKNKERTGARFQIEIMHASEKKVRGSSAIITLGDGSKIESWERITQKKLPASSRTKYSMFFSLTDAQVSAILEKGISEIRLIDFVFEINKKDNKKVLESYNCLKNL